MEEINRIADALADGDRRFQEFSTADPVRLRRPHAPGKWTGLQILAHVADSDMVCYTRLHQAVVEQSGTLFPVPMDGALWVADLACGDRPVSVSLAAIHGARAGMAYTLHALPEQRLVRTLKHPEMGTVCPLRYGEIAAEHGLHHLAQLERLLDDGSE